MSEDHNRIPCFPGQGDIPQDPQESMRPAAGEFSWLASDAEGARQTMPLLSIKVSPDSQSSGEIAEIVDEPRLISYVLRKKIGVGGFGEVWEAHQVSLERTVAVKRPHLKEEGRDSGAEERLQQAAFHKEALITGRLDHPNVVPVHDLGVDEKGRPLLAMKLVQGTLWTELLAQDRELPIADLLAKHLGILISVSQAVAFAHSRGILHRDLKPNQVMVGRFGEVFLMDWGLAVMFSTEPAGTSTTRIIAATLDQAPNPAGTVAYMAPEQTEPTCARLGPWTDVYLLGGILYYVLTGKPPHPQPGAMDAFRHACKGEIEPPEVAAPDRNIPPELSQLCMDAMAPNIGDRLGAAHEFIQRLQSYLSGAGRREESLQICSEVEEQSALPDAVDYEKLQQADRLVTRALTLWPENPQAKELQERLLSDFVRVAMRAGDLKLAEVQAGRVHDATQHAALVAEVQHAKGRAGRLALQRRVAIACTVVLMIASLALGALMTRAAQREKQRARTEQSLRMQAQSAERESIMQKRAAEKEQYYAGIGFADSAAKDLRNKKAIQVLLSTPESLRNWEWGRVMAAVTNDLMTLQAEAAVLCVAFSPDGSKIAAGLNNDDVRIWDASTGRSLQYTLAHHWFVWGLDFSPDGKRLATASMDGWVKVWDSASQKLLVAVTGHGDAVRGVRFSPDGNKIVTCSSDRSVRLWDSHSGEVLSVLYGHTGIVFSAVFSPDGRQILSASSDKTVRVWDLHSEEQLAVLAHPAGVRGAVFSPDGKLVATACIDGKCRIFDAGSTQPRLLLAGHAADVNTCAFSPDGLRIVTGGKDNTARVWDTVDGKSVATFSTHNAELFAAAFSPDGTRIITGSGDKTIKLWDVPGSQQGSDKGQTSASGRLRAPETAKVPAFPGQSWWKNADAAWDTTSGQTMVVSGDRHFAVDSFWTATNHAGTITVSANRMTPGPAMVRHRDTESTIAQLHNSTGLFGSPRFSPDDKWLLTWDGRTTVKLWRTDDWKEQASLFGTAQAPGTSTPGLLRLHSAEFSSDGKYVVTGFWDGGAKIWDTTGKELRSVGTQRGGQVVSVCLNRDATLLVMGFSDDSVEIWDVKTGKLKCALVGHSGSLLDAHFHPDGSRIATVALDNSVKVWDVHEGRELLSFTDFTGRILSVGFTRDGEALFGATSEKKVKVWETVPWQADKFPGDATMHMLDRIELWKRQTRLGAAGKTAVFEKRDFKILEAFRSRSITDGGRDVLNVLSRIASVLSSGAPEEGILRKQVIEQALILFHSCENLQTVTPHRELWYQLFWLTSQKQIAPEATVVASKLSYNSVDNGPMHCLSLDKLRITLRTLSDSLDTLGEAELAIECRRRALAAEWLATQNGTYSLSVVWPINSTSPGREEPQKPDGIVLVDSDQLTSAARALRIRDKGNHVAVLAAADQEMRAYLDKVAPMPDLTAVYERCLATMPPPLPPDTKIGDAFGPLLDELDKAAAKEPTQKKLQEFTHI